MVLVVLAQNLDLTPQVIIRTPYKLKLTHSPVPLVMLPLNFIATLIIALNNLMQTPGIVRR